MTETILIPSMEDFEGISREIYCDKDDCVGCPAQAFDLVDVGGATKRLYYCAKPDECRREG